MVIDQHASREPAKGCRDLGIADEYGALGRGQAFHDRRQIVGINRIELLLARVVLAGEVLASAAQHDAHDGIVRILRQPPHGFDGLFEQLNHEVTI
ncbi:MAG: hypothetical protein J2P50_08050 [Hyphomicrobiaceae bacterium]|nr:hypothetical protein [Hyphomicrobiaceae bacterium]